MAKNTAEISDLPASASAKRAEQVILSLFSAHKDVWAAASAEDDNMESSLWKLVQEIENHVARFPARTAAALAAKVYLAWEMQRHVPIRASLDTDIENLIGVKPE